METMMTKSVKFASLVCVEYDKETDRVFVKFEVHDNKYKDFALRIGARNDIQFNIRGEDLEFEVDDED